MKINELDKETFNQLVELESKNIIPILASVGINLSKEQMVDELKSFNDDEVLFYKRNGVVDGFVVYKVNEDHILIKTFNLRRFNNRRTLFNLLNKIAKSLKEESINLIKSHCHHTNQKSLNFHRKLGFEEALRTDKYIEFIVDRNLILDLLQRRCQTL